MAQVFNADMIVHVGMLHMELVGVGPAEIDGRGVGD